MKIKNSLFFILFLLPTVSLQGSISFLQKITPKQLLVVAGGVAGIFSVNELLETRYIRPILSKKKHEELFITAVDEYKNDVERSFPTEKQFNDYIEQSAIPRSFYTKDKLWIDRWNNVFWSYYETQKQPERFKDIFQPLVPKFIRTGNVFQGLKLKGFNSFKDFEKAKNDIFEALIKDQNVAQENLKKLSVTLSKQVLILSKSLNILWQTSTMLLLLFALYKRLARAPKK